MMATGTNGGASYHAMLARQRAEQAAAKAKAEAEIAQDVIEAPPPSAHVPNTTKRSKRKDR